MAQTIKVHGLGRGGTEVEEVDLDEAKLILEDAATRGWIVADAKTHEVVWEIGPDVDEIVIIVMFDAG